MTGIAAPIHGPIACPLGAPLGAPLATPLGAAASRQPADTTGGGGADRAPAPAPVAVAAIIPAHGQPGLLAEALAALLGQQGVAVAAIVVDDGCPFPETTATAAAFATAHPGRVFALRRANGGLSAARNTGIEFALAAFPALEAIYFLDADNRLHPRFLARALAALRAAPPETGWIYPDFDMFGVALNGSGAGPWSLLAHLSDNLSEAGSLVRRAVLEAGLRFDETMRSGFEDWDFWLQAAAAGFRGQHLANAGFRYRRRPESMLSGAERQREALLAGMRRKHAALFAPRRVLALEAEEAPRFALHETGTEEARLLLDPAEGIAMVLGAAEARARLLEAEALPATAFHPGILCFADPAALARLRAARLIRGLFWRAEVALREGAELVAVDLADGPAEAAALEALPEPGAAAAAALPERGAAAAAALLFVPRRLLGAAAAEAGPGRLESLQGGASALRQAGLRVTLPAEPGRPLPGSGAPLARLLAEAAALRVLHARRTALPLAWRVEWRAPREAAAARAFAAAGLGPVLPCRPRPGERAIGFVLPLFAQGGVERVVVNQAAVLRRRGWRTHLLVLGAARAALPAPAREAFESITLASGFGEARADWRHPHLGADTSGFGAEPGAASVAGLLAGLDVVVNTHSLGAHALMGRLRRLGLRTYVGLHLVERQENGQPLGNPHLALGYEHAYDGALVISRGLAAWCAAQGWPAGKLHLIPNAPGHATAPAAVSAALAGRATRRREQRGGRLRALFLGRLDPQKGIDRLAALIAATGDRVHWRVVGRHLLESAPPPLGVPVEPPLGDPAALDALYAWADVLVLPSRFEGVPLTVLEAQRLGCVPVATEAGEIAEIVAHGVDGFLVPQRGRAEATILAEMAGILERLAADPALLLETGRRAAGRVAALGWEECMAGFLDHLDRVVPAGWPR